MRTSSNSSSSTTTATAQQQQQQPHHHIYLQQGQGDRIGYIGFKLNHMRMMMMMNHMRMMKMKMMMMIGCGQQLKLQRLYCALEGNSSGYRHTSGTINKSNIYP